jgi:hypothetical protein
MPRVMAQPQAPARNSVRGAKGTPGRRDCTVRVLRSPPSSGNQPRPILRKWSDWIFGISNNFVVESCSPQARLATQKNQVRTLKKRSEGDRCAEDTHLFPGLWHCSGELLAGSGHADLRHRRSVALGYSGRRRLRRKAISRTGRRMPLVRARALSWRLLWTLSQTPRRLGTWSGAGPGKWLRLRLVSRPERHLPSARARTLPRRLLRPLSHLNRPHLQTEWRSFDQISSPCPLRSHECLDSRSASPS